MSAQEVNTWWGSLDPVEQEDVEQWWKDQDRAPFPSAAARKQVEAGLVLPGDSGEKILPEVTRFLRIRFNS